MKVARVVLVLLVLIVAAQSDDSPAWAKRTFAAPPAQVYAAALKSIAAQNHKIGNADEANKEIIFHVGTTAWSWGYNMVLHVTPGDNNSSNVSVDIARSGGKAVSWGSGQKEVRKVFDGIDRFLRESSVHPN